jgi:hypothetical protein
MDQNEVVALMQTSKTLVEWNDNCARVKKACDGYPEYWYDKIQLSGLADRVFKAFTESMRRISPDGCCHKTRLLGAPCPLGWTCPFPNRLPGRPREALHLASARGWVNRVVRNTDLDEDRKAVLMAAVACLREMETTVIENWRKTT